MFFSGLRMYDALCVQVDCSDNADTCKRYSVTGYPTLKIFRNGQESSSFDGPRSAGMFNDV